MGKTNGTQTNAGHGRTEHVLITILACISICLSEEMKDKCIAIIQKCIIAKIIIWWQESRLLTLLGKTNGAQTNAGHGRTEHGLITILACISICLSEEMKISVLLLFKSELLQKLSFDDKSLTKLRRKSENTLIELFWWVLARVRLLLDIKAWKTSAQN